MPISQDLIFKLSHLTLHHQVIQVIIYSYFVKGCRKKVHATILKGIVGDFKCTVFQRNLKESYGRPLIYVCECWRKVTKVGSTATVVRNSVLIISHITFRDCRVHFTLDKLSRNSCIQLGPEHLCLWSASLVKPRLKHTGISICIPLEGFISSALQTSRAHIVDH